MREKRADNFGLGGLEILGNLDNYQIFILKSMNWKPHVKLKERGPKWLFLDPENEAFCKFLDPKILMISMSTS